MRNIYASQVVSLMYFSRSPHLTYTYPQSMIRTTPSCLRMCQRHRRYNDLLLFAAALSLFCLSLLRFSRRYRSLPFCLSPRRYSPTFRRSDDRRHIIYTLHTPQHTLRRYKTLFNATTQPSTLQHTLTTLHTPPTPHHALKQRSTHG